MGIPGEIKSGLRPLEPIPTDCTPVGSLDEKIQCLLFDIYGTLFISGSGDIGVLEKRQDFDLQFQKLLERFGIYEDARTLHGKFIDAIRQHHLGMKGTGVAWPEVRIDDIWMEVLGITDRQAARNFAVGFELMTNPVYPMPNLKEMLASCKHRQIPMGIISNAQFYTLYLFEWFFGSTPEKLGFSTNLIFLSYRVGQAKPSLLSFNLAAKRLARAGIPPQSVLYVGNDMLNDIYPARKIGFKTALFGGDARSLRLRREHPLCRSLDPDIIVTDLLQLMNHL